MINFFMSVSYEILYQLVLTLIINIINCIWIFIKNPSDLKTFNKVIIRILQSNKNETLSTYHTLFLNLSLKVAVFLPFICAHLVIPGRTSCLLFYSLVYFGKYSAKRGRGPTKDISPFITLIN